MKCGRARGGGKNIVSESFCLLMMEGMKSNVFEVIEYCEKNNKGDGVLN